ncbi:hypothetical protein [Alkalihalobacterium chitinilyticum]|uniref:Uncharacterized protein n=1 Tax=Alkalihalobacterium chitinilyticum TaxID=2980103 RepID=A0ABT5VL05_9BACI|nr:hypothetical protein [Alkalihalobacterium chitinilyticum]MDE5415906.1 hypothetical protein [Alkalihalobacterium chitinilyticum]
MKDETIQCGVFSQTSDKSGKLVIKSLNNGCVKVKVNIKDQGTF